MLPGVFLVVVGVDERQQRRPELGCAQEGKGKKRMLTGACFCKAVKYRVLADSALQGLCYCTDCQIVGGSSHWVSYAVAPSDFRLVEGSLKAYAYDSASGREVVRCFCDHCGTQIKVESTALDVVSVNGMTLDDAARFSPQLTYFSASAPRWCEVDNTLAKFEEMG